MFTGSCYLPDVLKSALLAHCNSFQMLVQNPIVMTMSTTRADAFRDMGSTYSANRRPISLKKRSMVDFSAAPRNIDVLDRKHSIVSRHAYGNMCQSNVFFLRLFDGTRTLVGLRSVNTSPRGL